MICVFLADGFEEIEAITPYDLLKRAGVDVKTVGVVPGVVKGTNGVEIKPDLYLESVNEDDVDGVVLPGGMPGAENLYGSRRVKEIVESVFKRGKLVSAICAAPIILGRMGLLKGKKACCYPGYEKELSGAEISNRAVCVCDGVVTSKGPGTSLEFSLALVEELCGKDACEKIRSSIQWV